MSENEGKHDKALDLTEEALDALDSGDERKADRLINQAKKLDPSAVEEVVHDLEEAEGSSVNAGGPEDEDDDDLDDDEEEEDDEE